jgi:hypothetical protein
VHTSTLPLGWYFIPFAKVTIVFATQRQDFRRDSKNTSPAIGEKLAPLQGKRASLRRGVNRLRVDCYRSLGARLVVNKLYYVSCYGQFWNRKQDKPIARSFLGVIGQRNSSAFKRLTYGVINFLNCVAMARVNDWNKAK